MRSFFKALYNDVLARLPDSLAVRLMYARHFYVLPNLKNPKSFNEKIAWRKLFQVNPSFKNFADKIVVKDEIAKLVGSQHVIETLWIGTDPQAIPFERLQPPYVIKANHSSGNNIIIRSAQDIDKPAIMASLKKQLATDYAAFFRERGYSGIVRKIMIERLLDNGKGDVPEDYKFFVYHGRVHFIQVDYARFSEHTRNFYTREWKLLPVILTYPQPSDAKSKPEHLPQMLAIAEKIGSHFDFVRVDLYATPQGIFFGEATFYPGGGIEKFANPASDLLFGEPWHIKKL